MEKKKKKRGTVHLFKAPAAEVVVGVDAFVAVVVGEYKKPRG